MDEKPHRKSVLSKFSTEVGENVANLMVKEVVATVDKPGMGVKLVDEQELEWIMQVLDHSLQLRMSTNREFETVQSAVRVYVAWLTTITTHPHPSAPPPMLKNPLNYFSRLLDALLAVFTPRTADYCNYNTLVGRQSAEIRQILGSVRVLYRRMEAAHKEHDAEMWSRVLLFVRSANNVLLSKPSWPEEIGSVMAADLAEHLFDCWVMAAVQGKIPTKSYWKMLSMNAQQWITHVPVIEWWGRKLLALTAVIVRQTFGEDYCDIKISDESLYKTAEVSHLKEIWWQLLTLFDNPANITDQAEKICLENGTDSTLNQVVTDQATLSFFLAIHIYSRIVDLFYGDTHVSLDLHETEELNSQLSDFHKHSAENSTKSGGFHRQSNMSTTSSNHSTALDRQNEENQSTLTFSTTSHNGNHSNNNLKKLHALSQHSPATGRNSKLSAKTSLHHAVSLQTDIILEQAASASGSELSQTPPALKPAQFVWYILKTNKFHQIPRNTEKKPSSTTLLNLFLPWLRDAARISISPSQRKYSEDVISQRSLSSADLDPQQMSADGPVSRRSFAGSTNSASDISSPQQSHHAGYSTNILPSDPSTAPAVDGIAAGKSAALGALCRIVCSKSSSEVIGDEQLAQFLIVLHEALVERDRLMLCSLVFYSTELFKLGLKGVEILLPNYITAIDILLTESFKLRLHPSINEVDMRHSCLRALASVISWPTTFGQEKITDWDDTVSITKGNNNILGVGMTYEDLRPRILRTLIYALRNETDSMNLQLVLGLCHSFCAENSRYDLSQQRSPNDDEKVFAISALKQTISAVCDNLCKPQWCAELGTSLAAFDCLNALSTLPTNLLFYEGDHSTGALIVSSLCRFVNSQLQKPPPFHSRDLHSSVVAAFQSLEVWLCAAPILAEMESAINTVARTIEFGMTGGTELKPEEYKPASQRVYDAAESLRYNLFGNVGSNDCTTVVDEHSVIRKLGDDNVSLAGFQHFVIDKYSLISVHNLTHADFVSKGLPTVVMVCRTPFQPAHATLVQLKSRVENDENSESNNNNKDCPERKGSILAEKSNENEVPGPKPPKHKAEIPPECFKIECELDKNLQLKPPTPESKQVESELAVIRKRLAEGAVSPLGDRDQKNVWATSSLDSPSCAPPCPSEPFKKCNAVRVFLYDMGLLDRKTFGQDLIALDTANTKEYFDALHAQIDRHPAKKCETVSIFYVRRAQRNFSDILKNTEELETTSKSFLKLISRLGRIRRTREPAFWTGHWKTAFSPPPSLELDPFSRTSQSESHSLDGLENCIWWSDSQLEIAYQLPSERSLQRNLQFIHEKDDSYAVPMKQQTVPINSLQQTLHVNIAEPAIRVNRPQISPSQRLLITHNRPTFQLQDSQDQAKSDAEVSEVIDEYNEQVQKRSLMASMNSFPSINPSMLSIEIGPTPGSTEPPRSARFSPTARNRILSRQKTVDYTRYSSTNDNMERKASDSAFLKQPTNRQQTISPNILITNRPNLDDEADEPVERLVQRRFTTHSGASESPKIPSTDRGKSQQSPNRTRHSLTHSSTNSPSSSKASSPTVNSKPLPSMNSSPSALSSMKSSPSTKSPTPKASTPSPLTQQSSFSYIKSFFRRKNTEDSSMGSISKPEPMLKTLSEVTEEELEEMFPRMPSREQKEYTPSSTSSSLAPHSREGSSLTDDSGAISGKRSSDLSQPTAATRTRSTSTVNSECSSTQKPMLMPSNQARSNGIPTPKRSPDQRVLVVWLERIEDLHHFPYEQLLMSTDDGSRRINPNLKSQRADLHIIYLHNFEEGLVQVHTEAIWTKAGQPGPLVDGIVVSIDALPSLVRQTVANISRRKTVEVDKLSPAHRRRQAIAELAKKYGCKFGYTEFLDRFITNE